MCGDVDRPLHTPHHLEVPETAVGCSEDLVSVDNIRIDPTVGNSVRTCPGVCGGATDVHSVIGVGTGIPGVGCLERFDLSVRGDADRDLCVQTLS